MEEKNKSFGTKLEAFFAGKGFYIVLLLCVAVIGVSAWSMLSGGGQSEQPVISVDGMEDGDAVAVAAVGTPPPAVTAPPVFRTEPTPTPEPEAEPESQEAQEETVSELPEESLPAQAGETTQEVSVAAQDYYLWPVSGTVENGYSMTALTYDRTMRDWRTHDGVDIAAELGAQVRSAANGKVANVYDDERYGATVVISHNGGLESVYANLAGTPTVTPGEQVSVGQVIGAVGDTALCEIGEVSHLHFAMTLDGESVDPLEYLP